MKTGIYLLLVCATSSAQWLNHPTPGIPRTANGKPNLTAPSPRTADGKPDLSGMWQRRAPDHPLTADLKPGEIQPWAEALVQQRRENLSKDRPSSLCLPSGPAYITFNASGAVVKIIQTPGLIVMLHGDLTYRQIFLDGRALETNPNPSWMGYAVGRWEGDTLVVESFGFNDRTWLDIPGYPHTEALRMTERIRRRDFGHLDTEVTFSDTAVYARPLTAALSATLVADTELLEFVCNESKSNVEHWVGKASDDKKSEVNVAPEILAKYTGSYVELDLWRPPIPRIVEITMSGDALFAEVTGGQRVRLVPQSETLFFGVFGGIEFVRDDRGVPTHLSERHVSGAYRFQRKN
jgi:hypothetical protein